MICSVTHQICERINTDWDKGCDGCKHNKEPNNKYDKKLLQEEIEAYGLGYITIDEVVESVIDIITKVNNAITED